jgi:hypothetical protein
MKNQATNSQKVNSVLFWVIVLVVAFTLDYLTIQA